MAKDIKMIDKVIDDIANGKYQTVEDAVDDLIYYGEDPVTALNSVLAMETIDVIL